MFRPDPFLNPVSFVLFKSLPLVIMAVLIFNMVQRFIFKGWGRKRAASFYMAIALIILIAAATLIMRFKMSDILLIPVGLGIAVFIILKRKAFFPYTLRCMQCKKVLSLKQIAGNDSNLCNECENRGKPETE